MVTITEEHGRVRLLIQKLGSAYAYQEPLLDGDYQHRPAKLLTPVTRVAPKPVVAPVGGPTAGGTPGPSALAFALAGQTPPVSRQPSEVPAAPVPATPPRVHPPILQGSKPPVLRARTPAEELQAALELVGHRILVRDGKLFVSEASKLTPETREHIKELRDELLKLAEPWPEEKETSLAVFLGNAPLIERTDWKAQAPPEQLPRDIILNFETNGLNWAGGDEPIGVTVGTFDGFKQYLPFAHRGGGNLDRAVVIRFLKEQIRDKRITNTNTRFDIHMGRNIDVDFEAQGCEVSDIQHTAALLDDHRKRFALDVLAEDYLGGSAIGRVDESMMADYSAADVARRAEYQVQLVAELHAKMWPELERQELFAVQKLEDETIYAVCEMERNGSPIDMELLEQYHDSCVKQHDALMWEITKELGFAFEHTAQGWAKMLSHLHLQVPDSFSEPVLNTYEHPLVKKGQRASQLASLDSKTFAAYKKQIGADGILRYDINQLRGDDGGTVSGRFSIGYVHQVPNHDNHHAAFGVGPTDDCKGMCEFFPRRLFIGGNGANYLETDAMQLEFRLFSHLAANPAILAAYKKDPRMSFHKLTWAMLKEYKPDMLYSHTKNYNFAHQYGAKTLKKATMMGFITEKEANSIRVKKEWNDPRLDVIHKIEEAYRKMMPEGDQLIATASHLAKPECDKFCNTKDALHKKLKHRGYVKTLLGRRSRFPDNFKTYIGLNRVIQGTGADIVKRKGIELHRERKFLGFKMRLTVHDAFGGDALLPETEARVNELLNTQSFPELTVPILWSVGVGKTWADCK